MRAISHKHNHSRQRAGDHSKLVWLRLLLLAAATLMPCAAEQTGDTAAGWLQFIGMELRQLRVELLEQRVAGESERRSQIERDLAALRLEQNKYQSDEHSQKQQLAELNKGANDVDADSQAKALIQTVKDELASNAEHTRMAQTVLSAREADLNERLQAIKTRIHLITSRLTQLSGPNGK